MLYGHLIKEKTTKNIEYHLNIIKKDFCLKTITLSVENLRIVKLLSFV